MNYAIKGFAGLDMIAGFYFSNPQVKAEPLKDNVINVQQSIDD